MGPKNKSRARRCNYPWTRPEVDKLIEWEIIRFLQRSKKSEYLLPVETNQAALRALESTFTTEELEGLRLEHRRIRGGRVTTEKLESAIWGAAHKIMPKSKGAIGIDRARALLRAWTYTEPNGGRPEISVPLSSETTNSKYDSLMQVNQRQCLLEWAGLNGAVWLSHYWRESMVLRYGRDDQIAISVLAESAKAKLQAASLRLGSKLHDRIISEQELEAAVAAVSGRRFESSAKQIIYLEYLSALATGKLTTDHPLHKPISQSGVFEEVARRMYPQDSSGSASRADQQARFLRYLVIPDIHSDAILGRILCRLLEREHEFSEKTATRGWPSGPRDFVTVADRLADALAINRLVLTDFWATYHQLRFARGCQRGSSGNLVIFDAAFLLRELRPILYKHYGKLIDSFHTTVIKPLLTVGKTDTAAKSALDEALLAFHQRLDADPLLNCVLHAEVLGGNNSLDSWNEGIRADNRVRQVLLAYAYSILCRELTRRPTKCVENLFPAGIPLSDNVRSSIKRDARTENEPLSGKHLFAYAALIVTTIVDDPNWRATAHTARDAFLRYKEDPMVRNLLADFELRLHQKNRSSLDP